MPCDSAGGAQVKPAVAGIMSGNPAACVRVRSAVAAIMPFDSARRGEMGQSVAIVVIAIGAKRLAVVTRGIRMVLATGGKPMILAAAQVFSAHRAKPVLCFASKNLATAMPASERFVIPVFFVAPGLAAFDANRVTVGLRTGVILAAGVAVMRWVAHALSVPELAKFTDGCAVLVAAIVCPAAARAIVGRRAGRSRAAVDA